MPRKLPSTHVTDPDRIKEMRANDEGFFAPYPPTREALRSYLRLYNETREGWDLPAELGVLCCPYRDTVTAYTLPIPEGTWAAMEDPMKVLRRMAALLWEQQRTDHPLVARIDRTRLADMVGVYFTHEGWAPPRGKEREALHLHQTGKGYRLSETDDRRETRAIMAVQIDGVVHTTTQYRDDPKDIRVVSYDPLASQDKAVAARQRIAGPMPRILLEIAYGLVKLRPAYANSPEDNL
jgi:hypothetical protein